VNLLHAFGKWPSPREYAHDETRIDTDFCNIAAMESSESEGTYNVMHSTAIFAFDTKGRIRLLISDIEDIDAVVSDLKQLVDL
jgi:cytochrome oxidase Cu insertion factor (SCO1/SenC/PrrC family)